MPRLNSKNSISKHLLKIVFALYFSFTAVITAIQVYVDFDQARSNIKRGLENVAFAIKDGLSEAMWDLNDEQVDSIVSGVLQWKNVVGILVINEAGKQVVNKGEVNIGPDNDKIYWVSSHLLKPYQGGAKELGELRIFSNRQAAIDAVKMGVYIMVVNAVLKSIALWLLFVWAFRRFLTKPLQQLSEDAAALESAQLEHSLRSYKLKPGDEIDVLTAAFNAMLTKLAVAMIELSRLNNILDEKLTSSSTVLKTALESTADAIFVETSQGTVQVMNHQMQVICDKDVVLNATNANALLQNIESKTNNPTRFRADTMDLREHPEKELHLELDFGDGRTIECYSIPQRSGKMITGRVWSFRDITDRIQQDRLKNEFISTINHELRTPLTSIRGSISLLINGVCGEIPDSGRHMLAIALANSERLMALVNDILDSEKITAGKLQIHLVNVSLVPLVANIIEELRPYAEKYSVTMVFDFRVEEAIEIVVDPARFQQILANLISNAIKFSPNNDVVQVSIRAIERMVRISVSDHGEGIEEKHRAAIFQKFSQLDSSNTRKPGGTGLGLNISKSLAEKMNGNIDFMSSPGRETTFYVEFPIFFAHSRQLESSEESLQRAISANSNVCMLPQRQKRD